MSAFQPFLPLGASVCFRPKAAISLPRAHGYFFFGTPLPFSSTRIASNGLSLRLVGV